MCASTSSMRMRASGSSSTTSTRTGSGTLCRHGGGRFGQLLRTGDARLDRRAHVEGEAYLRHHATRCVAFQGEPLPRAVELLQPRARVANADTGALAGRCGDGRLGGSIVDDAQDERVAVAPPLDRHAATLGTALDAVLHGVLDQGLQDERRHERVEHGVVDADVDDEPVLEAYFRDVDVEIEQGELAPQGHLRLLSALEAVTQQVAEPGDHAAHAARVALDERGDGVEGVEQEVRVELTAEGVEPCLGELTRELDRLVAARTESQRIRARHAGGDDAEGEDERVEETEPEAHGVGRSASSAAASAPSR